MRAGRRSDCRHSAVTPPDVTCRPDKYVTDDLQPRRRRAVASQDVDGCAGHVAAASARPRTRGAVAEANELVEAYRLLLEQCVARPAIGGIRVDGKLLQMMHPPPAVGRRHLIVRPMNSGKYLLLLLLLHKRKRTAASFQLAVRIIRVAVEIRR